MIDKRTDLIVNFIAARDESYLDDNVNDDFDMMIRTVVIERKCRLHVPSFQAYNSYMLNNYKEWRHMELIEITREEFRTELRAFCSDINNMFQ